MISHPGWQDGTTCRAYVPACETCWTLDYTNAWSGKVNGSESCCTYDDRNFGRGGHGANNVKSSDGFGIFGECGCRGPIIGTTGI